MTRDPEETPQTAASKPSKALAGIAAALPLLSSLGCCLFIPMAAGGGPGGAAHFAEEMGFSFYGIMLAAPLAGLLSGALVGVAGTGRRVPVFLPIFTASLPWLVGLAGYRYGMFQVESALAYADASSRAALLAAGISESSTAHVFGCGVSAGVLFGVALGLSFCALGQRAAKRSLLAAGFALLALPMLGGAAWLMTGEPMLALGPIVVSLGALVAVGLGGASIGADEPRYRSGALAVGAVAAVTLAFAAVASAASTAGAIEVFSALASVSAESRVAVVAAAAQELQPLTTIASLGVFFGVLPMLGLAVWAGARGRVSVGKALGGAATVAVLAFVTGLNALVVSQSPKTLAELAGPPWRAQPSFEPVGLGGTDPDEGGPEAAPLVLIVDGSLVPLGGLGPVPIGAGEEALAERFRQLIAAAPSEPAGGLDGPDPRPGLLGMLEAATGSGALPSPSPSVAIAFDRRTDAASMRRVFEATEAAGARSIWLTGVLGSTVTAEDRARIDSALPLLGALAEQPSQVRVRLSNSISAAYAGADRDFLHGTIAASANEVTLVPRQGSARAPVTLGAGAPDAPRDYDAEPSVAYLLVAEGASVEDVARIVGFAAGQHFIPALYFDQLPPEEGPLDPAQQVLGMLGTLDESGDLRGALEALAGMEGDFAGGVGGLGGLAGLDDLGGLGGVGGVGGVGASGAETPPGANPRVQTGSGDVRGTLSREIIRRVIRRHISEVRYCYESELARHPNLEGRVVVRFIVGPSGSVSSAVVSESTLSNESVESCITRAVRRWTFPAPEGGGVVAVNYPFLLTT